MSKITKVSLPKRNKTDTYFILSDIHDYNYCENTVSIFESYVKLYGPKNPYLIINGDMLDCPEFMPKSKEYKKWIVRANAIEEYFIPAAMSGFDWGNQFFDRMQTLFKKIYYVEGNHEARLSYFMKEDCPAAYVNNFDISLQLNLKKRKITFIRYNDWLDIGKVSITHGMYHSTTALKKHYEACGNSVIFGHVHKSETKSFTVRGDTIHSHSLPCVCNLSPEYLKNRENNWTKGFSSLVVKSNGNFNYTPYLIWDDELAIPNGDIIR